MDEWKPLALGVCAHVLLTGAMPPFVTSPGRGFIENEENNHSTDVEFSLSSTCLYEH